MKSKVTEYSEILKCFKDGQTIAVSGQATHGAPNKLITCLLDSGAKHLTILSIDSGDPDKAVGRLITAGVVDKIITCHVAANPNTIRQHNEGTLEWELCPMGSFAERIRCGGSGLGGVLTKTGFGTVAEEGKQVVEVNGEKYLLETALRADIALTRGRYVDPLGNVAYHGTGHCSNPYMAMAADLSIVEADFMVDLGEISDDRIDLPMCFVDKILKQEVRFK